VSLVRKICMLLVLVLVYQVDLLQVVLHVKLVQVQLLLVIQLV